MSRLRWRFAPLPPLGVWREAMARFGVGAEAALAYLLRGFRAPEDLSPFLSLLPLKGLEEGAALLERAIREKKRIRIHGDYDADGLTGTAILLKGLRALGAEVHPFIPHRLEEGYGVLPERVPEHLEAAEVFVTVDCGIANVAELSQLVGNGVEVLVTDHHTPGPTLPPGLLVHPALSPGLGEHPTGAGVAFLLLWALHERLGLPPPLSMADLAAVGTVADVAPLTGWNRALVREGLRRLQASAHVGLRALAAAVGFTGKAVEVAFRIAPRINAASRLGQAEVALRLLLTEDEREAEALVAELNHLNSRRQRIEEEMLARLLPQVNPEEPAIVLLDEEGHPGVMGIVASRILEATLRPVFLVAGGKGSVRSLPPVSAVGALREAADLLKRFGGHREAAGFALEEALFPEFKRRIQAYAARHPAPIKEVEVLGPLPPLSQLPILYRALEALEPFGPGNPKPLFFLFGEAEEVKALGEGRHLAFRVEGVRAVAWRQGGRGDQPVSAGRDYIQAAVSLTENHWNGTVSYEAQVVAFLGQSEGAFLEEEGEAWAHPISLLEALGRARMGEGVYVPEENPEGLAYARAQGFRLEPPECAGLWLGLPPHPARREGVRVALGREGRARLLEEKDPLAQAIIRRLLLAYDLAHGGLFSEALERYWEVKGVQAT